MLAVGLGHYLGVAAILLVLGIFGIFLNRKNVIVIMMSIELILLAVNLNLVAFSAWLGDLAGQVMAMFVLTVAAAEAAIGLAIVVVYFRNRGSIEVEDVVFSHPAVAEAAAVGRPHDVKGEAIAVFVTLRGGEPDDALKDALRKHVRHQIGALAAPDDIHFAASLPKTRSGKIMRRLLRDLAEGRDLGDTTTLADQSVVEAIQSQLR